MLIREALQNAIRHAAPRSLSVVLGFDRKRLRGSRSKTTGWGSTPRSTLPRARITTASSACASASSSWTASFT